MTVITPLRDKAIQTAMVGDWENAIKANKELLEENPKDVDALNRLALAFTVIGKINRAKTTYQQVLKLDPLNPIALRSVKNLKTAKASKLQNSQGLQLSNNFIEENGKTKVVELINLAPASIIQHLRTGEIVNLAIKRNKIFVIKGEKEYIGVLPDDIGKRLIKFLTAGNKYQAYLKSVNPHRVIVFIKETQRSARFRNQPSFPTLSEQTFVVERKLSGRNDELEEENYEEEESSETF